MPIQARVLKPLSVWVSLALLAGSSPRRASNFSLFGQRKVTKRKATPATCVPSLRCGQPAVLAPGGVLLELASLKQSQALIRRALRSSAHLEGAPDADTTRAIAALGQSGGLGRSCALGAWGAQRTRSRIRGPLCMRRGAQPQVDKGLRLFERSEFEQDPTCGEHRRLPAAKGCGPQTAGVAFSLVTFFWPHKRKLLARRGELPASGACNAPPILKSHGTTRGPSPTRRDDPPPRSTPCSIPF
ncbi:hypothetical protein os1_22850 [Comamonadaceae bacterium OS-1]|nr:hypothetical protein os1_22850 [Comamonadaceae bacterium OS-1]